MKTIKYETTEEWLSARRGRITGSKLGNLISVRNPAKKKIGFYELIADRLGIPADSESAMDRGHRLEPEAIDEFEKQTGKKVNRELVICAREDNESIACSPDGTISETDWIECKCLSSARHIEAILTDKIPDEYEEQVLQAFIVNDKLKTLHFVFYDPRLLAKPFHVVKVKRKDVQEQVDVLLEQERTMLAEVDRIVNELTDF